MSVGKVFSEKVSGRLHAAHGRGVRVVECYRGVVHGIAVVHITVFYAVENLSVEGQLVA